MTKRATAIELFAGCGGLSTGLLDAGYDVRLGVDIDAPSVVAFDHNHTYRGVRSLRADVSQLSGADLLREAGLKSVDLLSGGPPCQPFSIAGKRLGLSDPRGHLIAEFVRLVGELRPRVVLLENVPALATSHRGDVVRATVAELERFGYSVRWQILNAADFGVPQARKRLIMVAVRGLKEFPFPPLPTHSAAANDGTEKHRTVGQALADLPDVYTRAAENIPNHEPTAHTPSMLATFALLQPGKRDPRSRHDRLHPDRPGYTLRAGSGNFSPMRPVHYEFDRVVSVRESARLQGFEDSFIWPDSLSRLQQYRQVGNAVPPPLARAVGRHIADFMNWKLDPEASRGDASLRPSVQKMTPKELADRREKFHRGGASYGRAMRGAASENANSDSVVLASSDDLLL